MCMKTKNTLIAVGQILPAAPARRYRRQVQKVKATPTVLMTGARNEARPKHGSPDRQTRCKVYVPELGTASPIASLAEPGCAGPEYHGAVYSGSAKNSPFGVL